MSGALDKQGDVRNFRSWYYDNLGLRGVEQRKALDLLLKDDEIGIKTNISCLLVDINHQYDVIDVIRFHFRVIPHISHN
jgi:hypothetical protein